MLKAKVHRLEEVGACYRINHLSWWAEEMPDMKEMEEGLQTLEDSEWNVDYIITHCCSSSLQNEKSFGKFGSDRLTDYFDTIRKRCQFRHWFFEHYHTSADWSKNETSLYHQIVELTEEGYEVCGTARRFKHKERVRFKTFGQMVVIIIKTFLSRI